MDYWIDTNRTFVPSSEVSLPLIHMTQTWETLESIIKEGFKPSYCAEFITNNNEIKSAAFPMVSLSNMSVQNAIISQRSYGTFGIALDIVWGQENDFNPVLYLDRWSNLTAEIIDSFNHIRANSTIQLINIINGMGNGHRHLFIRNILKIFAHSKNYDGKLIRKETLYDESYKFGLEREWRKIIKKENIPYFLVGEELKRKDEFDKILSKIRIDFKIEHIRSIIVEDEHELKAVEEIIMDKYGLKEIPKVLKIIINGTRHILLLAQRCKPLLAQTSSAEMRRGFCVLAFCAAYYKDSLPYRYSD